MITSTRNPEGSGSGYRNQKEKSWENNERLRKEGENNLENKNQCRECLGYGHIQAKCVNTLNKRKEKKVYAATLSDYESDRGAQEDQKVFLALTIVID